MTPVGWVWEPASQYWSGYWWHCYEDEQQIDSDQSIVSRIVEKIEGGEKITFVTRHTCTFCGDHFDLIEVEYQEDEA